MMVGRKKIKLEVWVDEVVKKTPRAHGNGARVMVPKHWIGQEIYLILPQEDQDTKFAEYMMDDATRLLDYLEKGQVKGDDVMLLDNMFTVSTILTEMDKENFPDRMVRGIDELIIRLDNHLKKEGVLESEPDEFAEDKQIIQDGLEDLYGSFKKKGDEL